MSLSDFRILTKLGAGAYSSVYKVERVLDNEIYALKKVNLSGLNEKQKQNSLNEIRILASIRHQNIIGYREAFLDEGTKSLCIIMQYADDGDLYQKITQKSQKNETFQQKQIWNTFIQIVKALKCLHDRKIMHRDLKSANVFLTKQGRIKLGDLNVSKITQKGLCQTQTGTPYYASPQVWKDEPYGPKSDIWSLGCVIYQMTCLRPPFQAEDMEGLYKKVVKSEYPRIPQNYSTGLNDLIRMLLQADPFKRPSCQRILGLKIIAKKITNQNEQIQYENPQFLQTIRIPKDIYFLTQNLPKPNYFSPKKLQRGSQIRIRSNKTEKIHKKLLRESKAYSIFPKINQRREMSQNKSLLLKHTQPQSSVVDAARNQLNVPLKDFVTLNKHIDEIKIREKKIRKQQQVTESPKIVSKKNKKTLQLQSKLQTITKIYKDNFKAKKEPLFSVK